MASDKAGGPGPSITGQVRGISGEAQPTSESASTGEAPATEVTGPGGGGGGGDNASTSWTAGRYDVVEVLGRGGMGEVLLANDLHIGRSVAVKRMRNDRPSKQAIARFLREARIQGRLEHPAVVPVHELGHDEQGRPFFAMKRLNGITLVEIMAREAAGDTSINTQFPRQRLLRAMVEVCLAVEFAHTRGVLHRDLKPANVLLGDFGEVYVLDWGIARVLADEGEDGLHFSDVESMDVDATAAGSFLGTPGYAAPEQIAGDRTMDGRADVYSLGCILFEILSGESLHPRGEAIASAMAGVDARPSKRSPDAQIPPELDVICARATAYNRMDRYASARDLGDEIQRFLDGNRDVALRHDLARQHLVNARAAWSQGQAVDGDGENRRRVAMREAGQALALDPTLAEAAGLVGRLMLEPPEEVPREVEAELAELDAATVRTQGRLAIAAFAGYFAFLPLIALIGLRSPWYLVALAILLGVTAALAWIMTQRREIRPRSVYVVVAANAMMMLLFSRMFTPFLVAPGLAACTLMAFAFHPKFGRVSVLWGAMAAGVLLPWVLELTGVFYPTMAVQAGNLVLTLPALEVREGPFQFVLALYVVSLLGIAAIFARTMAQSQRNARRSLQVQAWQLAQLMPSMQPGPSGRNLREPPG